MVTPVKHLEHYLYNTLIKRSNLNILKEIVGRSEKKGHANVFYHKHSVADNMSVYPEKIYLRYYETLIKRDGNTF